MSRVRVSESIYGYDTRYGRHYLVQVGECRGAATSLPEAKKLRAAYLEQGGKKPPAKMTLAQAVAAWMRDGKVAGLTASTLDVRRLAFSRILPEHGKNPLESLTVGDYERARDQMLEGNDDESRHVGHSATHPGRAAEIGRSGIDTSAGSRTGSNDAERATGMAAATRASGSKTRKGRARGVRTHAAAAGCLASGTVRTWMAEWRAFEAWCVRRKLLAESRAHQVARPRPPEPVAKALSLEALQTWLATCDGHLAGTETPYAALLACVALVPLRMSEFRGMQWRDLDLVTGTFQLQRAMSPRGLVKTAADGKLHPRTVPLGACVPYLQAQRAWQRAMGLPDVNPQGWVWSDERGDPLPYSTIRWVKDRWLAEAGLSSVRLHDFRHTGASRRIAAGVSLPDVQAMTGHRQASTLLGIYAHAEPVHTRAEEDRFAALVRTAASQQREAV